ncbi:MAG: argininosuccinate lyase, partial [Gammaproteobacteria bacterium]|nr:argininosuccinate lyase [Gammaproteobacteria bacterium]
PEIRPNVERMLDLASEGHPTATDLADWLVRKDVPFRDSHKISGQLVALAESKGCNLADLALSEMREISGVFKESVYEVLELVNSVKSRSHVGGTAPETVATEIARIQKLLLNRYSDLREAT